LLDRIWKRGEEEGGRGRRGVRGEEEKGEGRRGEGEKVYFVSS
jgi:hypothetical protein